MFDPDTAQLLKSAPALPDLDPSDIPLLLTQHYAELVSARLRGFPNEDGANVVEKNWPLERIADTFELITSVHSDTQIRRASAFVAATAQQIIARRQAEKIKTDLPWNVNRDRVDPTIAAALLFLAAEQYADANEAAISIEAKRSDQIYEVTIISEQIKDLAHGKLDSIIKRANRWRREDRQIDNFEVQALALLLETLITGIELLAAEILSHASPEESAGRFNRSREAFALVLDLLSNHSDVEIKGLSGKLNITYPGPRHLASLLLATYDGIHEAALTKIQPPDGSDTEFWNKWIKHSADKFPFVWPNHRDAIEKGFHQTGKSAVLILPTGAGKTTVSSLKIAGVLARGKKVIFLAPTHALVDQLTEDLQEIFPKELLETVVSSDFDLLLQLDIQFQEIEVMTPERCLAMLCFATEAFSDVGLLVFDECHLLSPKSRKIRRALDAMLCVLAFNQVVPEADILFLSAMLKNGKEFSAWVGSLTGREYVFDDPLWKPSRQARGVVIYNKTELNQIRNRATQTQNKMDSEQGRPVKSLRKAAEQELKIKPYALWGLQHNWVYDQKTRCMITEVSENLVSLSGEKKYGQVKLTPNANEVAATLAAKAAQHQLKTIIFVNTKNQAVSTARHISGLLNEVVETNESEQGRWNALEAELGDLKHSLLDGPAVVVPHNALMLRLERDLAERMFRRKDGAKVIVATPTLAQGLNLPAHLAILAGDKRADSDIRRREQLEAHEILNAAARAGRAGHMANGVVLLVPEPILDFVEDRPLETKVVKKLQLILPEDDRCVIISDPLEVVLDRIMQGDDLDRDVQYIVNRMSALWGVEGSENLASLFNLNRSFAAYTAKQNALEAKFNEKLDKLKEIVEAKTSTEVDVVLAILSSHSGLSTNLLSRLKSRIEGQKSVLPASVEAWVEWVFDWLAEDNDACSSLLFDVKGAILTAVGETKGGEITTDTINLLLHGIKGWIFGKPICDIEKMLGGDPYSDKESLKTCPRARELISNVIPRGISFIMGLVAHVLSNMDSLNEENGLHKEVVESMATAVRRGFDTPEKLKFAKQNEHLLSRVVMHNVFAGRALGTN